MPFCFLNACFSQKTFENYITAKDTGYKWQTKNVVALDDGRFYEISLVSQTWQRIKWTHRLIVYLPNETKHSNTLLLVLRHIYNRNAGLASLKIISDSTSTPCAFLYDIPNQPLFDGKEEDDLQACTFSQYIKSGDESWPLLFPMAKSVVKAMDAIQELVGKEEKVIVDKFIVAGHSKRGHTCWLAAAIDSRIKGIIPIAIYVLNAQEQLRHHLKVFGEFSTPAKDARGFLKELNKPLGKSLVKIIDPYSYKERLTLPKLIVCATNDEYFPSDALNLYWDVLKGPKSILYLSNASHAYADNDPRINPTPLAFIRAVAKGNELPHISWEWKRTKQKLQLIINANSTATKAVLWHATSDNEGFRKSRWSNSSIMKIAKGYRNQFFVEVEIPSDRNELYYGEIEFEQDVHRFLPSTQIYHYSGK